MQLNDTSVQHVTDRLQKRPIKDYEATNVIGIMEDGTIDKANWSFSNERYVWRVEAAYSDTSTYFQVAFNGEDESFQEYLPAAIPALIALQDPSYELQVHVLPEDPSKLFVVGRTLSGNSPAKVDEYVNVLEAIVCLCEAIAASRALSVEDASDLLQGSDIVQFRASFIDDC